VATLAPDRDRAEVKQPRGRDLSIDYLRTTLTLMVIAHHSCLAYTSWAHFDKQDMLRSTAPVVDITRWAFFDYAENFNDVFFMSLMFFVSGLFVYPALRKHGTLGFIRDRFLRLGVPFAFTVAFLMPIAYFASWQLTGRSAGFLNFYKGLARIGFLAGPPWFIWLLLFFDVVLALVVFPFHRWLPATGNFMRKLRCHPFATSACFLFLMALVYLPLIARYGPEHWTYIFIGSLVFQTSRIGLYALWLVFGFFVGIPGFANGLLSRDGGLARRWPLWILRCIVAYNVLWFFRGLPSVQHLSEFRQNAMYAVLWMVSCAASSFGFLALFRGINLTSRPWMNSLSRSAYVMYLVHYVYITWMQRLVLDRPIHAGFKFLFVFLMTTLLSWLTAQMVFRIPKLKTIL
jgi:glucan biosynthesis protein C